MMFNGAATRQIKIVEKDGAFVAIDPRDQNPIKKFENVDSGNSSYLNLVFVFVWTALANLVSSALTLGWGVAFSSAGLLTEKHPAVSAATSVVLTAAAYATLQMVSALSAVFNFARLSQTYLRAEVISSTERAVG